MRTPLLILCFACSLQAAWQAGAASVDISPTEPIWMAGYASRTKPSEAIRQPIHVKALALKDDDSAVSVVVTLDLVGIRREMIEPVAARAARELHIPRERILFNASHTHSAPLVGDPIVYAEIMGPYFPAQKAAIARYTEKLPGLIFDAISQAVAKMQPATVFFEQGSPDSR
jgi:Neutral/alkaline non-lysosomal ceramidase.